MNRYNIYKIKSLSFIIVAFILLVITILNTNLKPKNVQNLPPTSTNYTSKPISSQESSENLTISSNLYEVKSSNDIITVYKDGEKIDVMFEEVQVSSLPESDVDLLEKGVSFENYKDLIKFLENYE